MTKFQLPTALMGIAQDMINKGWQPVWCPARASGSFSPVPGCTGGVEYPAVFPQPSGPHKLAFRPPPSVLIIDVDHYDDKHGQDTIDLAENWLGMLPWTYKVTSRGYDNPSGRYMYRIPDDLVVTDSSLYQFRDPDDGRTDVEIVRTGHRFSWAPGDFHYKNDEMIVCYDPDGDSMDEMPAVDELPELPEKWVAYFYNPPVPQQREAYTRPSDGADWWLSQADSSLGTDAELSSFAYSMLLSRVPEDEIYAQWERVAVDLDPARPWERRDFDRHVGSRAQGKADQILQHQDMETDWFAGTGADLDDIARRTTDAYNLRQAVTTSVEVPHNPELLHRFADRAGIPLPDLSGEDGEEVLVDVELAARAQPGYQQLLWQELMRTFARREAAKMLQGKFSGYENISALPDPPDPSLFVVTGKDNASTSVVGPQTITVFSGHRASGKTWACAVWAAQIIRAGGHVIWQDFERQPHGLSQKLRSVGIPAHLMSRYLHYTSKLPDVDRLTQDIAEYAASGRPVLFVVDAFRGLQNTVSPGTSANDGDAVEQVYLDYLNPVTEAGGTVVLLDHMSKTGDAGTFGSERKESAADYVLTVKQEVPFTKTVPGFSSLVCSKDRYGVVAAGTPAGFLWMPGDGSKSGSSIDQYPDSPEMRNWSPLEAVEAAALENSQKGQREVILTLLVQEAPLRLSINKLAKDALEGYPDFFKSESSTKRYIRDMVTEGKFEKDGANGHLIVPAPPQLTEGE